MPGLISSAAPGKKAAPKAPARRRPAAPTGPPPSAQSPISQATSLPPPSFSPPPSQAVAPVQPASHPDPPPVNEPAPVPIEPARETEGQQHSTSEHRADAALSPPPIPSIPHDAAVAEKPPPPSAVSPTFVQVQGFRERPQAAGPDEPTPEQGNVGAGERLHQYNVINDIVSVEPSADTVEAQVERAEQSVRGAGPISTSTADGIPERSSKRTRKEAPASAAAPPAKKTKRSSTRSNLTVTATANGENNPAGALTQASNSDAPHKNTGPTTKKTRPSRAPPRPKRRAHEKSAATIVDSDDETEGVETENAAGNPEEENAQANEGQGAETARQKRVRKKPAKARKRKAAPAEGEQAEEEEGGSDPELHEVDPHALSMWELSHDTRHGKMSERGKKMDEIDWDDVVAKRRAAAELIASGGQSAVEGAASSTENANGTAEGRTEGEAGGETQRSQAASGPQPAAAADDGIDFELDEEGNIVENQASLAITRDAQAVAAAAADRPVEDVNDLTVHINRTTWINDNRREHTDRVPLWKWKSDPWSEDETDKFYDALCMFGTDFFIISKMFPPKTRRMIKAKFTREEKIDPQRINNALNGKNTRRLDLEHYARETARDISVFTRYEGLEHAQAMINESMKEKQDAMTTAAQKEAQVEEERREKDKQKEKTKGTRTRKSKKAMGGTFGGGGGPDDGD